MSVRLGAVSYLNTKPLVYGLDAHPDLFSVRFDVPAQCAALLHEGRVDVGLIPAIEYLRGDYDIVPGRGDRLRWPDCLGRGLQPRRRSNDIADAGARRQLAHIGRADACLCARSTGVSRRR